MRHFLISFIVLFSMKSFSEEVAFNCNKLLDGNVTGKALSTVKSLDFELRYDVEKEDAEIKGTYVVSTKYSDDEQQNFYNYFIGDRSVKIKKNQLVVKSYDSNILMCKLASGACREWSNLKLDLNTGIGEFQEIHSNGMIFGKKNLLTSIKFSCELVK